MIQRFGEVRRKCVRRVYSEPIGPSRVNTFRGTMCIIFFQFDLFVFYQMVIYFYRTVKICESLVEVTSGYVIYHNIGDVLQNTLCDILQGATEGVQGFGCVPQPA